MGTGQKSTKTDLPLDSPQRDDGVKLTYELFKLAAAKNGSGNINSTQTPMQTPAENQQLSQPAVRQRMEMQTDLRRQVARRRGMTRSILAGESNTGSASTLG